MADTARPIRIGVSACLLGEEVRWDGRHKREAWVAGDLARRVELVPVCPEVEIGLGIPRPPIRLEDSGRGRVRLVRPSDGEDLTARMAAFAELRVRALADSGLSGYVLKARSPSCGKEGVDVWGRAGSPRPIGRGLFAETLLRLLPGLPVEEEEALRDPRARREFLARVRAYHGRKEDGTVNRWLVKTDPDTYSFADLVREGTTRWEGVKNALARRHLSSMRKGDVVLVYETGDVKAVVGEAVVAKGPYPDPGSKDAKAVVIDLRAGKALVTAVPLAAAKSDPVLAKSPLVRIGRLSVMPVTEAEWVRLSGPR